MAKTKSKVDDVETQKLISEDTNAMELEAMMKSKRSQGLGILDQDDGDLDDLIGEKQKSFIASNVPMSSWVKLFIVFIVAILLTFGITKSKVEEETDFSNVQSALELELGKIHHWCINGDDNTCSCEDPLIPRSGEGQAWFEAHEDNKLKATDFVESNAVKTQDIVFLGSDNVELWGGGRGEDLKFKKNKIKRSFNKLFSRANGGPIDALPLGIKGDTAVNLLWRIRNGEFVDGLNPKVWWIHIGMNDIRAKGCSTEVTVMGIIRVVEEIQQRKAGSKIVLNAILPSGGTHGFGPKAWTASLHVNRQLFLFAEKHDNVYYFDETPLFLDKSQKIKFKDSQVPPLNQMMYSDELNLSVNGHEILYEKIQKLAMELLLN